ncbi:hypothetical protein [Ureibacillus acetophenoni]|nr:hypothetical protein [Ureibacillus acetophenoni]
MRGFLFAGGFFYLFAIPELLAISRSILAKFGSLVSPKYKKTYLIGTHYE